MMDVLSQLNAAAVALARCDQEAARVALLAAIATLDAELEVVDDSSLRNVTMGTPVTVAWRNALGRVRRHIENGVPVGDGYIATVFGMVRAHRNLLGIDMEAA